MNEMTSSPVGQERDVWEGAVSDGTDMPAPAPEEQPADGSTAPEVQTEAFTPAAAAEQEACTAEKDARAPVLPPTAQSGFTAQGAAEKRRRDIDEFRQIYPEVEAASIPREVWAGVAKGLGLTTAYMRYENVRLKAELEAERQKRSNAARAVPSQASQGRQPVLDPYEAVWRAED